MDIQGVEIGFRAPCDSDLPFIFDSWVESFRLAHAAGPIPMDLYRNLYREIIRRLLARPSVIAVVAYNVEIPDQALGYIVFERSGETPIVHYMFVKHFFRRNRLAKALLDEALIEPRKPFIYTFKSRVAGELVRSWSGARFDPIVVRKSLSLSQPGEKPEP